MQYCKGTTGCHEKEVVILTDHLNSYIGSLVGVHVGDSLGAPYEQTYTAAKIAGDIATRGGLTFFDYPNPWAVLKDGNEGILPAGRPTDDSEQTARLARSLIACNGLDPTHLRNELYASTFSKESILWNGRSTGGGKTTFNALSDVPARNEAARKNPIGTNGSLMRSAPLGLWWARHIFDDTDEDVRIAYVQEARTMTFAMSDVTHAHPHSKDACWLYVLILAGLLIGNNMEGALACAEDIDPEIKNSKLVERIYLSLRDEHLTPYDPGAFPARGAAEFSLYVACFALKHATSFAEGVEIAIRVGGDTDTYAAIAGGLLGAHYGYEAIPLEWRTTILGHDQMVDYAMKIYEMRFKM